MSHPHDRDAMNRRRAADARPRSARRHRVTVPTDLDGALETLLTDREKELRARRRDGPAIPLPEALLRLVRRSVRKRRPTST